MDKGKIFNIERYAVHDGPGIRTIVFLSGCPLKCKWCANPEGQKLKPQLMYFPDKCTSCGKCVLVCDSKAIEEQLNGKIVMNWNQCKGCLSCAEVCENNARKNSVKFMTPNEVVDEVIKDIPFYRKSNGGITLSGGEPLVQHDFASKILKLCKERGIHTAIETSGFAEWSVFSKVLEYTDFVFFDIKHTDPKKHKEGTGKSNKKILDNFSKIMKLNKNIVVRIPIIPKFNDSIENIINTANIVKKSKNVKRIELLPYHELGILKYEYIGKSYLLKRIEPPENNILIKFKNIIEDNGVKCEIL